jgi:hypothetical protein
MQVGRRDDFLAQPKFYRSGVCPRLAWIRVRMGLSLIILWKTNLARARATHLESPFFLTQLRISPAAASIASHRPPPASHLAGRRQHLISPAAASIASRRPPPASSQLVDRRLRSGALYPLDAPADAAIPCLRSRRRETLAVRRLAPRQG